MAARTIVAMVRIEPSARRSGLLRGRVLKVSVQYVKRTVSYPSSPQMNLSQMIPNSTRASLRQRKLDKLFCYKNRLGMTAGGC
jgi:hypothetical protein